MSEMILGIDLGTTNSEVAVLRNGVPVVLTEQGDPILPSFVGLSEDGRLLVGRAARNQYGFAPERTIKSIKRKMGEDTTVQLGEQSYRPQEISAMILRTLKERAERELGETVTKAVITVPAFFNDTQRQATREAGELAGLEVVRILNEPTAAALVYHPDTNTPETILVYDLGGGTFDVSIVRIESGIVEVLASHGDTHLGGDDFDECLLNHICDRVQSEQGVDLRTIPTARARVLSAAEKAKRTLSDHPFARIEEEFIAERDGVPVHLNLEVSREDFEKLIRPLLQRTMDCLQRAMSDAKLGVSEINRIVLVGGSTRTPLVGELLAERLRKQPHREINPDLCVAMGAAVQAGIIAKQSIGSVLVDITPHSLGISCLDSDENGFMPFQYRFAPVLDRGTALPASRSEVFTTVHDRQKTVQIEIYQGESTDVRRNHRIGEFVIEGLAAVPAGNQIVVQFDLTLDGTLNVSARERLTGLKSQVSITPTAALMNAEQSTTAVARIDEMWGRRPVWTGEAPSEEDDSIDDDGNDVDEEGDDLLDEMLEVIGGAPQLMPEMLDGPREGQRETMLARAMLEKAERLRPQAAPEDQVELDGFVANIRQHMTDRRWEDLQRELNALTDLLFYLEDA